MWMRKLGLLALGLSVFSNGLVAETSTEAISQKTPWERSEITYFSWINGPAFSNPQPTRPYPDAKKMDHITLTNQVTFAVPLFAKMSLEILNTFDVSPFGQNATAISQAGSATPIVAYQDPNIGIQGTVFESGRATLWGRYEVGLPLSEGSRKNGQIFAPKVLNVFEYQPTGSSFIFRALLTGELAYFSNSLSKLGFWASPQVFYEVDKNWRAIALYGVSATRDQGKTAFIEDSQTNNLGLGFRYTFEGGHYVQPFVNFYPFGDVARNTHVSALFFAVLK